MKRVDRTARGQIQSALGELGEVLPRVEQTDADHPYVGWYVKLHAAQPGCKCDNCRAARAGEPTYFGFHRRDVIERVGIYKHQHPRAA